MRSARQLVEEWEKAWGPSENWSEALCRLFIGNAKRPRRGRPITKFRRPGGMLTGWGKPGPERTLTREQAEGRIEVLEFWKEKLAREKGRPATNVEALTAAYSILARDMKAPAYLARRWARQDARRVSDARRVLRNSI